MQYFDEEWQSYIDVEDVDCLVDKTKLRVTNIASVNLKSVSSAETVEDQDDLSEQSSTSSTVSSAGQWPSPFAFPAQKVPANLMTALDQGVALCNPKQRYLRGQLLQILCGEAVKYTAHPDHFQKIEMAKSIITAWPHLKEPVGRGYDGWLASIVDSLKCTRRTLGLIDKSRSAAIMERKRALSSSSGVSTERQRSEQRDSGTTLQSTCTEGLSSSKVARRIPRYSKKSVQVPPTSLSPIESLSAAVCSGKVQPVQPSSKQQHSVETVDIENCTDIAAMFGSQLTTVAVIEFPEFPPSTRNNEQQSVSTSTLLSPESLSAAVCSGKVQAIQPSLKQQQSVETANIENCTDITAVFGSQLTTAAVIEFPPSTHNNEQLSVSTTMPLSPIESLSKAVSSSKTFQSESELSEIEDKSSDHVVLMKDLWSQPEHTRQWDKLLHLLKLTFDSRRMLVSHSSTTKQIRDEYPALFFREAFIQEYCLLTASSESMTKAMANIAEKCQLFVKLTQKKLETEAGSSGRIAGVNTLSCIMSQLSLEMQHENDPDVQHHLRAVAGLLLLPHLLKDNSSYFIMALEVII